MAEGKERPGKVNSYQEDSALYGSMYRFADGYLKFIRKPKNFMVEAGVSPAEIHLLHFLVDGVGSTVTELAQQIGCTVSAASQNVSRLEKKGMLKRAWKPGDGKTVTLRPTPAGEELVEKHKKCVAAHNAKLYAELSDYSPEEVETLFQMVTRLARFYREQ